jgi:predicted RNase H-like HicB family nuclease
MTYRVDYERDVDGYWTATIDESQGVSCVTQGRGLAQARKRIREALALALALDDAKAAQAAELVESFDLPAKADA